jgi:hypothetical protein
MGYNVMVQFDPAAGFYCLQGQYPGGGDPNTVLIGDWYFGPNGIIFQVAGKTRVYAQAESTDAMNIPVTGHLNVSGANCYQTCNEFGCSGWSCSPNGAEAVMTGETDRTLTSVPVKQTSVWTFQKRSQIDIGRCPNFGDICA